MEQKHTPGPWVWEVSTKNKDVTLESRASMHPIVMQFDRWGMNSAAPLFRNVEEDIMQMVGKFAVQRKANHVGFDQFIDHPDARLIAAAPDLLEALEELADLMEAVRSGEYRPDSFTTQPARAAIAKATGTPAPIEASQADGQLPDDVAPTTERR